jgi:hypothetical protein
MTLCIAPMCEERAVQRHHIVTRQECVRRWREKSKRPDLPWPWPTSSALLKDGRNLTPICLRHHASHHNRFAVLPAASLPSGVFEFAEELMGAGAAFEYLRRTYRGDDPRLDYLKGRAA